MRPSIIVHAACLLFATLAGCARELPPTGNVPRPVKIERVAESSASNDERFVGTLRARQRAELGFETGGRIASILVDVGDRVRSGQVLARLESGPAQWRLEKAEAERQAAEASLAERRTQLKQNEALARDKIISPTALESVQTQFQQAQSQLRAAESALLAARREVALASITAPFDGEIVARQAQPHRDIQAGQPVINIEAGKALEVVAMLPDAVAARLEPGREATAVPSGQGTSPVTITLDKISARSENGSLVPALFRITGSATGLRSGAVVSIELAQRATRRFTIPASALMPDKQAGTGSVFVLDERNRQIARRPVSYDSTLLPEGRIPIRSGLQTGDAVVVAGIAFLSDGQAAVEHRSPTQLHGKQP
ncbi:MAG: efflux RND transporter periplasmic adaptor subunit [Rhodocyclales bacterium GT-UBC]|nr:MAG: efflux RND transporter periplasmic adaptor subunit [Rhodocyclales bacterium GT-UBC]